MFARSGLYQTMQPVLESRNQFCRNELDCDFSWSRVNPAAPGKSQRCLKLPMKCAAMAQCAVLKRPELPPT